MGRTGCFCLQPTCQTQLLQLILQLPVPPLIVKTWAFQTYRLWSRFVWGSLANTGRFLQLKTKVHKSHCLDSDSLTFVFIQSIAAQVDFIRRLQGDSLPPVYV